MGWDSIEPWPSSLVICQRTIDRITRAGAGTKVILAGDPSQIDVPTLSRRNNGLVTAADCMKGSPLCAYLKMDASASVRSPLATDAIQRMVW